ncbi:MAG: hypothetical protein C0475_02495 [Planctomyces sp.]|nr:hypothetical protein [Planctomyces sp.]
MMPLHPTPAPALTRRPPWAIPLAVGVPAVLLALLLDEPLRDHVAALRVGGDLRRELAAWQQFGQFTSIVVASLIVWVLDPHRRPSWLDGLLGLAALWPVCQALKVLCGRLRPGLGEGPWHWLGPVGEYPLSVGDVPVMRGPWQIGAHGVADLWAMPSSHTALAVGFATILAYQYSRLTWLWAILACLVGFERLRNNAHWSSDVTAGALLGVLVARTALRQRWASRWFAQPHDPPDPRGLGTA